MHVCMSASVIFFLYDICIYCRFPIRLRFKWSMSLRNRQRHYCVLSNWEGESVRV